MPTFITLFRAVVSDIRNALGTFMSRRDQRPPSVWLGTRVFVPVQTPPATPLIPMEVLTLAWHRISRAMQRFTYLHHRWQTNTLPKPRPSRAGKPRPDQTTAERPKRPYLPTRRAWLAGATDFHVRNLSSQLGHLLATPDATEFLTAVPRAGRILRPLCHMLGINIPAPIVPPPKPRKPRKRPEKPPREPARHGKYTVAQARRYIPGRIPESMPKAK